MERADGKMLVIPVFIPHLGCPHDCLFCNQQKISGENRDNSSRVPVGKIVEQWLERKKQRSEVQVAFFGGSFTCLPATKQIELLSSVQPYIKSGQVDSIRLSTRPDCIDAARCVLLHKYNVSVVELGAQSLTDHVLQKSLRGHSVSHILQAFSVLKNAGMQVGIQLMPGLPGESSASFLAAIDQVVSLAPDFVRLYPALVVKDSGLAALYLEKGYQPLTLNKAIALCSRSYQKLTGAGIEVVRMGLQPSESLAESVIAGPYHPAFGELVQSRLWFKKIRAQLAKLPPDKKLHIHISHRDVSALVGMKKKNIKRLEILGYTGRYSIIPDKNMQRGSIRYAVS